MSQAAIAGVSATATAPQAPTTEPTSEEQRLAQQVIDGTNVQWDAQAKEFHVTNVDGKEVKVSPLEAIALTLTNRYKSLSQVLGNKVVEMQSQLEHINEASEWATKLGSPNAAENIKALPEPSKELKAWMDKNNIDISKLKADPPDQKEIERCAKLFDNYTDQLSGTNDLKALSLKNATQKAEQAMSTADAILGVLHRLLEGMSQNLR